MAAERPHHVINYSNDEPGSTPPPCALCLVEPKISHLGGVWQPLRGCVVTAGLIGREIIKYYRRHHRESSFLTTIKGAELTHHVANATIRFYYIKG